LKSPREQRCCSTPNTLYARGFEKQEAGSQEPESEASIVPGFPPVLYSLKSNKGMNCYEENRQRTPYCPCCIRQSSRRIRLYGLDYIEGRTTTMRQFSSDEKRIHREIKEAANRISKLAA
jgi:hypothetical protein